MDTTSIVIGIILFLITVVPVIAITKLGTKKSKKIKKAFINLVNQHELTFTTEFNWSNKILGIDEIKKVLVYVSPEIIDGVAIDLHAIKKVDLVKHTESGELTNHLNQAASLGLNLIFDNSKELYLPFFDSDVDDMLQNKYLYNKAYEWQKLIEKAIVTKGPAEIHSMP